jgi:hypothetical protein
MYGMMLEREEGVVEVRLLFLPPTTMSCGIELTYSLFLLFWSLSP